MAVSPDANVTFWYVNMTRDGETVRLVTHMLEAVGVAAAPAGGPGYCCGSTQEATRASPRVWRHGRWKNSIGRSRHRGHLVPVLPHEHGRLHGAGDRGRFRTQHITQLLAARAERLRPLLTHAVPARAPARASRLPGRVPVNTDVPMLLGMIPGLTVLEHPLRIPGHMCSAIRRGAWRAGAGSPGHAGCDGGGWRGHTGDRLPFLPPRRRGAGAWPPDPRGELDPPAG